jgi:hypothetical protein
LSQRNLDYSCLPVSDTPAGHSPPEPTSGYLDTAVSPATEAVMTRPAED